MATLPIQISTAFRPLPASAVAFRVQKKGKGSPDLNRQRFSPVRNSVSESDVYASNRPAEDGA